LLGGLWHGANWTFLAWGAYHGVLLVVYKRFGYVWDALPPGLRRVAMFGLVVIGWVFFRASSFEVVGQLLGAMFVPRSGVGFPGVGTLFAAVVICTGITQGAPNTFGLAHRWRPSAVLALSAGFAFALAMNYGFRMSPFLYFQF